MTPLVALWLFCVLVLIAATMVVVPMVAALLWASDRGALAVAGTVAFAVLVYLPAVTVGGVYGCAAYATWTGMPL